jgi:lipid-binding SYLF domain-containing protein
MQTTRFRASIAWAGIATAAFCASTPALASDRSDAQELVTRSRTALEALVQDKDFSGFRMALSQARGVLIFPNVVKVGFVLGGSGGSGVLLTRDPASRSWVGPAFYTMGSASLGLQAGASSAEMVMVINSQKALDSLHTNKLKLGGDASVALGSKGAGTGATATTDFIVYSKVKGAYAGVAVDGSVLDVRQSLNTAYYGQPATPIDILVKRSVNNPEAAPLLMAVEQAAK